MYPTRAFDVLLFDFGGVLIEYASAPRLLEWLQHSISIDELWRRWLMSPAVRGFESGQTAPTLFAASVVAELALPVSPEQFLKEFAVWPRALMPGAVDLLQALRRQFTLASFSNTNAIHWERVGSAFDLLPCFDRHFPSHLIGKLKPDADAFEHIVKELGCDANRILFFDDNPMNIDSACRVGLEARRVDGPNHVVRALRELGIDVSIEVTNPSTSSAASMVKL